MNAKPWQIAVIVVGLVVLVIGVGYSVFNSEKVKLPHRIYLIDVVTGEAFEADTSRRAVMVPAEHPETGRLTLIPMSKNEQGEWTVSRRDLSALKAALRDTPGVTFEAVDAQSGAVLVKVGKMATYRRK